MNFIKAEFDGVKTPKLKNAKVGKLRCQKTCSDIVFMKISSYTFKLLAILLSKDEFFHLMNPILITCTVVSFFQNVNVNLLHFSKSAAVNVDT